MNQRCLTAKSLVAVVSRLDLGKHHLVLLCVFVMLLGAMPAQTAFSQNGLLQNLLGAGKIARPESQPDVSILLFTQDQCPPCAHIRPMIDHLIGEGFPIQKVDVAATPGIAHRWSVSKTPTLVVISEGKEVHRQEGVVTAHQVGKMLVDAGYAADLTVLTQKNSTTPLRMLMDQIRPGRRGHRGEKKTGQDPTATIPAAEWSQAESAALASSVRIKVRYQEDGSQITDFGTGTVIHRINNDILILTCGHVFRDSQGQASIEVDLGFSGGDSKLTVPGQLLMFDAGAPDVAIISATTDFPVQPVEVAEVDYAPVSGNDVFTVGCDHGAPATIRRGRYLSTSMCGQPVAEGQVDHEPPARKYDVSGRPVVGRSGGGLFSKEGKLIGVCNAAVIEDDQGVYSAVVNVHQLLAKTNLSQLFEPGTQLLAGTQGQPETEDSMAMATISRNRFRPDMAILRQMETDDVEALNTDSAPETQLAANEGMLTIAVKDDSQPGGQRIVQVPATRQLLSQIEAAENRSSGSQDLLRLPNRSSRGAEVMRGQSLR